MCINAQTGGFPASALFRPVVLFCTVLCCVGVTPGYLMVVDIVPFFFSLSLSLSLVLSLLG